MSYFLVIGCILCVWAVLLVMGSERTQRVREIEKRVRSQAKTQPIQPTKSPEAPAPAPLSPAGKSKR
jgi:hypothetical protein